jgi:hypothetical protein
MYGFIFDLIKNISISFTEIMYKLNHVNSNKVQFINVSLIGGESLPLNTE